MEFLLILALLLFSITRSCCLEGNGTHSDVLAPQEVRFVSLDYKNILHWKQHANSTNNQQYYVQWKVYGKKHWTKAAKCQGIRRLHCDLSQETSDPREWYYARVLAAHSGFHSPWVLTARFNPKWETSVSPPTVKLRVTEKGIVVQLKPPRSAHRRLNGSWISMRRLQRMSYTVYIMHNDVDQKTLEIESCAKQFLISDLSRRTTYCLQAESRLHLLDRRSPLSPKACVTTL
ncbi:interleukin-22 receptor subunit alpha-2 [Esox lucius]|uniref:Interleukin-22 receptor subunit alpha-2 n=1 Tax=Esox lucius TaxID=8010 RepID=A0A3P8YDN7_ESOLU|nr:interleukin-22 receptor subunit alpha-2 [Esox lucius]